jgi:hypothetical protein
VVWLHPAETLLGRCNTCLPGTAAHEQVPVLLLLNACLFTALQLLCCSSIPVCKASAQWLSLALAPAAVDVA